MNITDLNFIKGFIEMATEGYKRGWHERNGGNLSYRLKKSEVAEAGWCFAETGEWIPLGIEFPELAGEYFLVTGAGAFFKNIGCLPCENIGICELDKKGGSYRVLWGLENSEPTSEFLSHLINHEAKIKAKGENYRVIYHCHTANVIALTFLLPLDQKVFTRELWQMITECALVFPEGVGVMPWEVCGGREIAQKSAALMKEYDVIIWAHHGIFSAGENFDLTFGLAETVEKAAEVLIKVMSVSGGSRQKSQTITSQNLEALAEVHKLNLKKGVWE